MIESRKVEDLTPEMQEKVKLFQASMKLAGIDFILTATFRDQERQNALYAQGRTKPGKVVTWTRNSRHTKRTAFDIAILRSGQPTWDTKIDLNENDIPDYQEAGKIGESVGLEWGGKWHPPDYPHFQLKET